MKYTLNDLIDLSNMDKPELDFEALYALANHEDDEVRMFVAELLSYDSSGKAKEVLLFLVKNDLCELVRAEAADSLSFFEDKELMDGLFALFPDEKSDIVKSYLLFACIDIADCFDDVCISHKMNRLFCTEENQKIKIICAGYLYQQGQKDFMTFLQNSMVAENPHIRLFAVTQIWESCTNENIKEIQSYFKNYNIENEELVAVRGKIDAILSYSSNNEGERQLSDT